MLPKSFWILPLSCSVPHLPPGSMSSKTVISLPAMSSSQSLITVLGCRGQGQSLEALEVSLQVDTDSLISLLWGQQFNPPKDMVTQPYVSILFTRTSQDALSRASATSRHTAADTVSFLSGCQPCRAKKSGFCSLVTAVTLKKKLFPEACIQKRPPIISVQFDRFSQGTHDVISTQRKEWEDTGGLKTPTPVSITSYFPLGDPLRYSWNPGDSARKESACSVGDLGSIPGLGRSPGEGNSYSLQCSGLENSMDRGAWRAAVHSVAESDMPERLSLPSLPRVIIL